MQQQKRCYNTQTSDNETTTLETLPRGMSDVLNDEFLQMQTSHLSKKILMVGNDGVGKSCFVGQFCNGVYKENKDNQMCQLKLVHFNELEMQLQIWDVCGRQRNCMMSGKYYDKTDGIFLMYDVTDPVSFESVKGYMKDIKYHSPTTATKFLVGNKKDLAANQNVSPHEAEELARNEGFIFREISTKSKSEVDDLFQLMIEKIGMKEGEKQINDSLEEVPKTKKKQKKDCCLIC
ncbi:hypothetical protein EIN_172650 [Entamoeba invadens IP1]|uniref:Uncharacterized protein n=2 Tax=Entamoeba invadens TaxID=33085 RepID=A0A0A1TYI9_ENTIV|nr:hypothetical protein EIN_172650 [Entamoeba invadens IP1]ELP84620.1 hypothetical protein EIN_172650 [Entamoeba invadens IP1]BAN41594.1 hypothetical protein, conserved [Entamoeba invadens]|eukprot:XP_004183966.1 hypothetical protein EIN_172650 [Entamoeba invadens IP1]